MDLSSSNLIRPLGIAENHFLEVLISRFSLRRKGQGSELNVRFDNDTPAIWRHQAKSDVQQMMPDFKHRAQAYQEKLDAFLLNSQGKVYNFNHPDFFFRYASGGALPVVRIESKEYYCLFYREVFPVGWNIANGGCDTRNELLNPVDAIERELREELVIVDLKNKKRYSFAGDLGKALDHPQFAVSRRYWQERHGDLSGLEEVPITLKWLGGPDSLTVQMSNDEPHTITDCFLNINAEDFGIEVDKIANINLDKDAILLDGETIGKNLINVVVGLFEVNRLNREVIAGKTEFLPDYFYWDAKRYDAEELKHVIKDYFLPYLNRYEIVTAQEIADYRACQRKFDLCPVTKRIIKRYISLKNPFPIVERGPFDVFLSFGGEDISVAKKVFDFLMGKRFNTFFSKESIGEPNFQIAINDALDSSKCLVAVATKPDNLKRPWVEFECTAFHNNKLSGLNPSAKLIPFISGFNPLYLPLPLRVYEAVEYDPANMKTALDKLAMRI